MKPLITILVMAIFAITCVAYATEIPGGPVFGDWYSSGNPYNINGEITVPVDSTLNIHEGVAVVFQGHYKLIVNGYLEAMGMEGDSILFTATDTSIGWHGIRFIDAPDSSHLFYCIIEYGRAIGLPGSDNTSGGGILCDGSNPVLSHCSFRHNYASEYGGAMEDLFSSPTITFCTFSDNYAGLSGGAMSFYQSCDPIISHCVITGNEAGNYSGGIQFYSNCNPQISHCQVIGNSNGDNSGGVRFAWNCNGSIEYCDIIGNSSGGDGSGIRCSHSSSPTISNCNIIGNEAGGNGAGIVCYDYSAPPVTSCLISNNHSSSNGGGIYCYDYSDPTISASIIQGNSADLNGGGIFAVTYSHVNVNYSVIFGNLSSSNGGGIAILTSVPTITNCTIYDNAAAGNGAQMLCWSGGLDAANCIVGGNSTNASVHFYTQTPTFEYCDVYNSGGPDFAGLIPPDLGVTVDTNANGDSCDIFMNIFEDPCFVDPANGDYQLLASSPCIDAGCPDSPLDPDGTVCDIGAFYFDQTGIVNGMLPIGISLSQNYPNPFNARTTIRFVLHDQAIVKIDIFDLLGRQVQTLLDEFRQAGTHTITFDASGLSSGVYFYRLQAGETVETKRMVLLK